MTTTMNTEDASLDDRTNELFLEHMHRLYSQTDRLFIFLMVLQWLGGIAIALVVSPRTWIGETPYVHLHVWAAVFLGGVISSAPIIMGLCFPGATATRHVVAVAQAAWSALLIHLSGGRLETHFHIFGSLAFLSVYRDWRVLITASAVVASDHIVRGFWWPLSVYGISMESPFRWIEHAAWVVFEDVFLILSCLRGQQEGFEICKRQSLLIAANNTLELRIEQRTSDLVKCNETLHVQQLALDESIIVAEFDLGGTITYVNDKFCEVSKFAREDLIGQKRLFIETVHHSEAFFAEMWQTIGEGRIWRNDVKNQAKDGNEYWADTTIVPKMDAHGQPNKYLVFQVDITSRKLAEAELSKLNLELMKVSRQAGMAEVATGVLHNVGNVLNSVNVSANLLTDKLSQSRVGSLQKAADVISNENDLAGFFTKNERGKHFPSFLNELASTLAAERDIELQELAELVANIAHIKEIVSMQQSFARSPGAKESVQVAALVEDGLKIVQTEYTGCDIKIERQFQNLPNIVTDKHKLLQILVNLLSNAKHAFDKCQNELRQLTLRLDTQESEIRIEVRDNGEGIPQANLTKIFSHGFTTKKNGHGFGLHSSALMAQELGGSLSVHSEGPGHGAAFTLRLPHSTALCSKPVVEASTHS